MGSTLVAIVVVGVLAFWWIRRQLRPGKPLDLVLKRGLLDIPLGLARGQWSANRVDPDSRKVTGQGWLVLTKDEIVFTSLRIGGAVESSKVAGGAKVALAPIEGLADVGIHGVTELGARYYDKRMAVGDARVRLENVESIDEERNVPGQPDRLHIRTKDGEVITFIVRASGYQRTVPAAEHSRALAECVTALKGAVSSCR